MFVAALEIATLYTFNQSLHSLQSISTISTLSTILAVYFRISCFLFESGFLCQSVLFCL